MLACPFTTSITAAAVPHLAMALPQLTNRSRL